MRPGWFAAALWTVACIGLAAGNLWFLMWIPPLVPVVFAAAGYASAWRVTSSRPWCLATAVAFFGVAVGWVTLMVSTQAGSGAADVMAWRNARLLLLFCLAPTALAFLPLLKHSRRAYGTVVGAWMAGSAAAAAFTWLAWATKIPGVGTVAVLSAPVVGVVGLHGGLSREMLAADPPRTVPRRALPVMLLVAVVACGAQYAWYRAAQERGRAVVEFARGDARVPMTEWALYNGLRELTDNTTLTPQQRDAVEVYVAVRFRDRLAAPAPLAITRFQSTAVQVRDRQAHRTDTDLLWASETLGVRFLDELNRPYRER